MMQETMRRMQGMNPREGVTSIEQKEWMDEHQQLLEQMMGQMMTEHHMMMPGMAMQGTTMPEMPHK